MPGFIVIEGIDGSGTTTQTQLLANRLSDSGLDVWLTSEPTSGEIGRLIRRVLAGELEVDPCTLAFMYAGDRNEHIFGNGGIREHLEHGALVVCDRYLYSSLAYQSIECAPELVARLNSAFPPPELAVFLDVHVSVSAERLRSRSSREIFEYESFQSRVRDRYLEIFSRPAVERRATVDGSLAQAVVAQKIWEELLSASILEG